MRKFTIVTAFAFAAMFALAPAKADQIVSGDKCWLDTDKTNYHWGACPSPHHEQHGHHDGYHEHQHHDHPH
jgi:hypothetical protein